MKNIDGIIFRIGNRSFKWYIDRSLLKIGLCLADNVKNMKGSV